QPGAAAGFLAEAAGQLHVRAVTREGDGQVVQLQLGCQGDVGLVLGGQRRSAQAAAAAVDALVVGERAADQYHAVQLVGTAGLDAQDHAAIVEQQFDDRSEEHTSE